MGAEWQAQVQVPATQLQAWLLLRLRRLRLLLLNCEAEVLRHTHSAAMPLCRQLQVGGAWLPFANAAPHPVYHHLVVPACKHGRGRLAQRESCLHRCWLYAWDAFTHVEACRKWRVEVHGGVQNYCWRRRWCQGRCGQCGPFCLTHYVRVLRKSTRAGLVRENTFWRKHR